ncbi:hypothetical protein A6V39_05195 [Candidatus Mycoplasma haematobovis]|uniref:Uncharacterized protein n=1 Tax=Candidatus Mycoplasma haematobovis TaxID=432608 RepID=A0A1A9QCK6_9MOLU|nr:hypothetical protein [Candidatus Mycoplasma haematobovis]OAL09824.1 hypothetical protein A6V39_05195 [Candidatus Mycoplasma haematobovis]
MNPLIKAGISIGAIAGVSGAGYGIYNVMQPAPKAPEKITTYASVLEGTLLTTTDDSHKDNWVARLNSLKKVKINIDLVNELNSLKIKDDADLWKELREWCKNNINNPSKGESDKEFKNIQSYCTFSIKEKIKNAIDPSTGDSDGKWATAHGKLKNIDNLKLNQTLRTARDNSDTAAGKKSVKDWCVATYSNPYKGESDPDFDNAKQICIN